MLNLDTYDQWKDDPQFVEDVMRFLDNVMTDFINRAPDELPAVFCNERSVGLELWDYTRISSKNIPFGSVMSKVWNKKYFKTFKKS